MCIKIEKTDNFIEVTELLVVGTVGPKPGLYPPEMPVSGVELIGDGGGYITPGVDGVEAGVDIPPAVLQICKIKAADCYAQEKLTDA